MCRNVHLLPACPKVTTRLDHIAGDISLPGLLPGSWKRIGYSDLNPERGSGFSEVSKPPSADPQSIQDLGTVSGGLLLKINLFILEVFLIKSGFTF